MDLNKAFKKGGFLIASIIMLVATVLGASAETFDGNTVYINDSKAYISATPHTLTNDGVVTLKIISKTYTGDVNVLFGFNSDNALPKGLDRITYTDTSYFDESNQTWVEQTTKNTNNIANMFNIINYDYDDKDKWYYTTDVPVTAGVEYELELELDIIGGDGKYDIAIYPSSYGINIGQAIANGHFYMLDPYWSTSDSVYNLDDELISYWDMNDNTDPDTDKHGAHDLPYYNTPVYTSSGKLGGGYDLESSDTDAFGIADHDDFSFTDGSDNDEAFSFSYWVKHESLTNYQTPVSKSNTATHEEYYVKHTSTGNIIVRITDDSASAYLQATTDTTPLTTGSWHHVVVTYTGSEAVSGLKIYVDGIRQSDTDATSGSYSGMENKLYSFGIGKFATIDTFDGIIDEFGVWNRELSAKEVEALYNQGNGLEHPFGYQFDGINHLLLSYYTFDINSPTDYTSNENDGTDVSSPTYGVTGIVENAVSMSGASGQSIDFFTGGSSFYDSTTTSRTVNMWVKPDATTCSAPDHLFWLENSNYGRMDIRIDCDGDDDIQCSIQDSVGWKDADSGVDFPNTTQFHMVTCVWNYEDNYLAIYLNGEHKNNLTTSGAMQTNAGDTGINALNIYELAGDIDELGIWGRALNSSEISTLYASSSPNVTQQYPFGNENNLIARLENTLETNRTNTSHTYTAYYDVNGVDGVIEGALDFDGSGDYVAVGNIDAQDGLSEMSISHWFYLDTDASDDYMADGTGNTNVDWKLRYDTATDSIIAYMGGSSNSVTASTNAISTDQWYHVVMVYNGSQTGNQNRLKIYIDGVDDTTSDSGTIPATNTDNYGNIELGVSWQQLDFKVDDVRIYDRALTDAEITELYERTNETAEDMVVYFPFDELYDAHNGMGFEPNPALAGALSINNDGYDFDGTDDWLLSTSTTSVISEHLDYGVSMWFKVDSFPTPTATDMLFTHSLDSNDRISLKIHDDGVKSIKVEEYNGAYSAELSTGFSDTASWHHAVITNINGDIDFWLDGSEITTNTETTQMGLATTSSKICLGNYNCGTAQWDFDGQIRDFKVFSRGLSEEDIIYLYNGSYNKYNFNSIVEAVGGAVNYSILLSIVLPQLNSWQTTNPVTFNYTIDATSSQGNVTCTMEYDGTSRSDTVQNGSSYSFQWVNNHTTNIEEQRTFNGTCVDNGGGASDSSDTQNYYFDDIAPRFSSTYNGSNTTADNIWINNTFTDYNMDSTYTQLESKYNETNSSLSGNFSYNKYIDISQYGIGTWYVHGNATDDAGNSMNYNTSFTILPDANFLTIRAMNYLGITPLTLATIWENHTDTTQVANPFQKDIYQYLSKDVWNLSITTNISDYEAKHRDYNGSFYLTRHNWEHNITMNPSQLVLAFYQDGVPYQSKGFIADVQPKRFDFHNTTVVAVQQELAVGYVHVRFGDNSSGNWTQYYEYINDETEHITEDLEILDNADWSIHVQALDNARSPLEDVQVRVQYMEYTLNNWTNGTLLGQRLTTDDGFTFFVADSSTQLLLTFTKNGYTPVDVPITVGDESFTRDSPLQVFMTKSSTGVEDNVWVWTPSDIHNDTTSLYMLILAVGRDRVQYQTDYMIAQGLSVQDITPTCDNLDRCQVTLAEGTHFVNTQDLTIHFYIDNEYWGNRTIPVDQTVYTEIFEPPNVDDSILAPILLVGLLILTAGISLRFRSRNAGIATWTTGAIVLAFISTAFVWLAVITIAGLTFRWIYSVISQ